MKNQFAKAELLERIQTEHEKLEQTLATIGKKEMTQPGVVGEWSVKDVLAHLMDWERRLLEWYRAGLRGETPQLPAPGMTWANLAELNERIYQKYRRRSLTAIMEKYQQSYQQTLKTVQVLPESDMLPGRFAWTKKQTLAVYVAGCTCDHYKWADNLIRKWAKAQKKNPSKSSERSRKPTPSPNVYIAVPPSGQGRGVLVIHAWWGLNGFFKSVCDRLAQEGFIAMAPDLFEGQVATTIAGAKRLRAKPRREPTYKTLVRAIEQLKTHPAVQGSTIGVVGFSMGAHWALWLSQRPELPIEATVTFYGARDGDYTHTQSAFLVHLAEQDDWVSDAALRKFRKNLATAGRVAEFFVYPDTSHWFFESDRADAYNAQAAELAWRRTIKFLNNYLKNNTFAKPQKRSANDANLR